MRCAPTLPRALAALAALTVLPAARLPGFPPQVAAALVLVALWRFLLGADGRALLRPRLLALLRGAAALAGFLLLAGMTRGLLPPLTGLLVLLAVLEALALVEALTPFPSFVALLLATTQVTGAAFVVKDAVGLGLSVASLVLVLATMLVFERRLASLGSPAGGTRLRRVRLGDMEAIPARTYAGSLATLATSALLLGGLVWLAAPRSLALGSQEGEGGEEDEGGGGMGLDSVLGPDDASKGIQLGDVGRIKLDLSPFFEVRLPAGRSPFLRENTYDVYREGAWTAASGRGVAAPWRTSAGADGWVPFGRADDPVRGYDVALTALRGNHRRLFLERDAVRVRILRAGVPLPIEVLRHDNEQADAAEPVAADDVIEMRVVPPVIDALALERARSDASVSPRASYLELPATCRPLEAVARQVVGEEANPWRRALRLAGWLRGPAFTYTLEMPKVDTTRPVVDFVLTRRRGHCEYFAAALTLMLRSIGQPARIVRGFRGGDRQEERGTWIVRASNYHAWTEVYFEGRGWIPLDPTPPDREAVDAATFTRAADEARSGDGEQGQDWLSRLLGLEEGAVTRALERILERYVKEPVAYLLGPRGWPIGLLLLALALALLARPARIRVQALRAATPRPTEPYRDALRALAAAGMGRRRAQTPREYLAVVARWAPEVEADLRGLTAAHEQVRYATRDLAPEERQAAPARLARVRDAASRRRGLPSHA